MSTTQVPRVPLRPAPIGLAAVLAQLQARLRTTPGRLEAALQQN